MKIGLLADIHEDTDRLALALAALRHQQVDRLLVLGDLFDHGRRFAETTDLLIAAGAEGVWGNHDLGLCVEVGDWARQRYPARALAFMASLRERMVLEDVLLCHGLPDWDLTDPTVYYLAPRPESDAGRLAAFAASARRVTFVGHFHRWLACTPAGPLGWAGDASLALLRPERYLVVLGAVCDGWCATYDTDEGVLVPLRAGG